MNTVVNNELIKLKAVYESLDRLIGSGAKNSEDFLRFFLREIVSQTKSKKGYIFTLRGKAYLFTIISEINHDENKETDSKNKIYNLTQAGDWVKALDENKLFVQNFESALFSPGGNERLYENPARLCFFPLTINESINVVVVITDKDQDYDTDDINYLELLTRPAGNLASIFRRQEDLITAKEKAEINDRRKLSYLINISHEIKTPVNAIAGFSQLLKENDLTLINREKFLDVILESSTDLVEIINNVAEISNVESGMIKITEKEIHLSEVFNDLTEQFKDEASRKKLLFKSEIGISDDDGKILADNGRLKQILSALLSNSLKFTFSGQIIFGCKRRNNFIEFFVSDTGIGITKEEKDKVFDHFFQATNSVSKSFKGTGLGLTITRAVTEKMGGEIWCNSVEGKGSDFHFTIPYKRSERDSVSKTVSVPGSGIQRDRKKVVLIAEDDDLNFSLIRSFLSVLDLELLRAVNGKEAVDICSSGKIDLVLMDIKMPIMDGLTATRIIKEANPDQIIIAQTAYINDREIAIECGCTDFIAKPFGKIPLLNLINSYL
jgi:signal transduction histidine kinase/CheY-like chemotaxis protein